MTNIINEDRRALQELLDGLLPEVCPYPELIRPGFVSVCQHDAVGDFFSNHALVNAKVQGMTPEQLSERLVMELRGKTNISACAKAGFINFRLPDSRFMEYLLLKKKELEKENCEYTVSFSCGRRDYSDPAYVVQYAIKRCRDLCALYGEGNITPRQEIEWSSAAKYIVKRLASVKAPNWMVDISLAEYFYSYYSNLINDKLSDADLLICELTGKVLSLCLNSFGSADLYSSKQNISK